MTNGERNGSIAFLGTADQSINFIKSNSKKGYFEVYPAEKPRSMGQNKYYHGVIVRALSYISGHTPREIHKFLKDEFYLSSTTTLTTTTFEEFLEEVRGWSFNFFGISFPDRDTTEAYIWYEYLNKEKLLYKKTKNGNKR